MDHFFPLIDQTDRDILMHKEAHFSGSFPIMIEYYEAEGKGAMNEFDLERIYELSLIEEKSGISLVNEVLSIEEKELISQAKAKYQALQRTYDMPPCLAQKIADLIFSEDIEATEEINALLKDPAAIPILLELVGEEDFYNPLFPGYGQAPFHAIKCLGKFKSPEAIIPIFESLGKAEFFGEETAFQALFEIGAPAKDFLLKVVQKMPITKENENAAIGLSLFKNAPDVISTCLDLLFFPASLEKPLFFIHLLLVCDELKDPEQKEKLKELSRLNYLPPEIKEELDYILKNSK